MNSENGQDLKNVGEFVKILTISKNVHEFKRNVRDFQKKITNLTMCPQKRNSKERKNRKGKAGGEETGPKEDRSASFQQGASCFPCFTSPTGSQAIASGLSRLPSPDASLQVPEQVLQRRVVHRGDKKVVQVLLQWPGDTADLATWEDFEEIKQRFPHTLAWGQAVSQQGDCQRQGESDAGSCQRFKQKAHSQARNGP